MPESTTDSSYVDPENENEFGELLRFTIPGYLGGLLIGVLFDSLGLQTSVFGQWLVRTLSGEGESILEGAFALRRRLLGHHAGMAEAYGWGKLLGMTFPWFVDMGSRLLGVDAYGVQGFYIPYFYSMSDQIGASVSGFLFLRRKEENWMAALHAYFKHPVMLSGLIIIFIVPLGLLAARLLGFSPTTQVRTAFEAIAANLCWIPPVVGWISESRKSP